MSSKPINKPLRGIRDSIPGGYILGRTGSGSGPPILLPFSTFTTPGYVANTTIQVGQAAGGDLSGTYPDPTVARINGNAVKAQSLGSGDDGKVLTWVNADVEWEAETPHYIPAGGTTGQVLTKINATDYNVDWETSGAGNVVIGSGAPSALETAGVLYSRSDEPGLYVSQPTNGIAIVQHARADAVTTGNSATATVALANNPVAGNLLVAFVQRFASGSINTDWTQGATKNDANSGTMDLLYRYVQNGDGKNWTFSSTTGGFWNCAGIYELSGVSGVWATDFTQDVTGLNASTPFTTTSMTTGFAGQIGLIGFSAPQAGSPVTGNISAGWTLDEAGNGGSYGTGTVSQIFASNGATDDLTVSSGWAISFSSNYISGLFGKNAGSSSAGWVKIAPLPPGLDSIIDRDVLNLSGSLI